VQVAAALERQTGVDDVSENDLCKGVARVYARFEQFEIAQFDQLLERLTERDRVASGFEQCLNFTAPKFHADDRAEAHNFAQAFGQVFEAAERHFL
jgi:hypothetical protein